MSSSIPPALVARLKIFTIYTISDSFFHSSACPCRSIKKSLIHSIHFNIFYPLSTRITHHQNLSPRHSSSFTTSYHSILKPIISRILSHRSIGLRTNRCWSTKLPVIAPLLGRFSTSPRRLYDGLGLIYPPLSIQTVKSAQNHNFATSIPKPSHTL